MKRDEVERWSSTEFAPEIPHYFPVSFHTAIHVVSFVSGSMFLLLQHKMPVFAGCGPFLWEELSAEEQHLLTRHCGPDRDIPNDPYFTIMIIKPVWRREHERLQRRVRRVAFIDGKFFDRGENRIPALQIFTTRLELERMTSVRGTRFLIITRPPRRDLRLYFRWPVD